MTGLTPTITLPVAEYDAKLAEARADGMRAVVRAAEDCEIVLPLTDGTAVGASIARRAILAALAPATAVPADAGLDALVAKLKKADVPLIQQSQTFRDTREAIRQAIAAITALRARQPPAPVGEPVAWIVHDPEDGDYLTRSVSAAKHSGHAITPLYATPAPQVPPEVLRQVVEGLAQARDLLAERIQGNAARSPGHNARLAVEAALAAVQPYVEGV